MSYCLKTPASLISRGFLAFNCHKAKKRYFEDIAKILTLFENNYVYNIIKKVILHTKEEKLIQNCIKMYCFAAQDKVDNLA